MGDSTLIFIIIIIIYFFDTYNKSWEIWSLDAFVENIKN